MSTTYKRLTKEYKAIQANPIPFIKARPLETNILEWYYCIVGPKDTVYDGGEYYGTVTFPEEYPFKPPSIRMMTPNGRFQTNFRLCLSMSDYHPGTWNPAWSVATVLMGLLSFMLEDTPTTGSIQTSSAEKRRLAVESIGFNRKQKIFTQVFPELLHKKPGRKIKAVKASQHGNEFNFGKAAAWLVFVYFLWIILVKLMEKLQ